MKLLKNAYQSVATLHHSTYNFEFTHDDSNIDETILSDFSIITDQNTEREAVAVIQL